MSRDQLGELDGAREPRRTDFGDGRGPNRLQQAAIDYLLEENRVLRAAQSPRRFCLTDDPRRRLVVKGKVLGRRRLADIAGIVTPDTSLRLVSEARRQELTTARRIDAPVARAPTRTSPRSWYA